MYTNPTDNPSHPSYAGSSGPKSRDVPDSILEMDKDNIGYKRDNAVMEDYWSNYSQWTKDAKSDYDKDSSAMRASLGSIGVSQDSQHWKTAMDSIQGRYDDRMTELKEGVTYGQLQKTFDSATHSSTIRNWYTENTSKRQYGREWTGPDASRTAGDDISAEEWGMVDEYSERLRSEGLESYYTMRFGAGETEAPIDEGAQAQKDAADAASGAVYGKYDDEDKDSNYF